MITTKTKAYQQALQSSGISEKLARNAAVVLRADEFKKFPRTERGQRVIDKLKNEAI